jgi:hypothetical protein
LEQLREISNNFNQVSLCLCGEISESETYEISGYHGGDYEDYEDYEEREVGGSEGHYRWGEQNLSSVLKVPRHCPFVLLASVSF